MKVQSTLLISLKTKKRLNKNESKADEIETTV